MSTGTRENYRSQIRKHGKEYLTLEKMLDYGFWPEDIPIPFEIQKNETPEAFEERQRITKLLMESQEGLSALQKEMTKIDQKISALNYDLSNVANAEIIRRAVSRALHDESIQRRTKKKEARAQAKKENHDQWLAYKKENIVYIGRGYSNYLGDKETDVQYLKQQSLPIIQTDRELADFLNITYSELRSMAYHRDVTTYDHYVRFEIPKKRGGMRQLATPNKKLKQAQRTILEQILNKITVHDCAHGFLMNHSVITNAQAHPAAPALLINLDLENFFPTITFGRVRGLFASFGYSGFIASLFAMLCTYCERIPIEKKGKIYYVKIADRVLPQGAPTSPMISNIICKHLDEKMQDWALAQQASYTRYADDMSISFLKPIEHAQFSSLLWDIQTIVSKEGFRLNKEKTKFLSKSQCQAITGIVVNNEKITISKKWRKNFRATIYNAQQAKQAGTLSFAKRSEIQGMLAWLKAVNDDQYEKLILAAQDLLAT